MYLKLLRLEAKLTSRIFLPLMGAVMALSGLAMAAVQLAGPDALIITGGPLDTGSAPHNRLVSTLCGLLALGAFLSMVGLMITAVVVTIQRFYKNLLGDEGYLMFALPATPAQHLAAKLTVSVGWTFASLVLVLALTAALVGSIPVTLPDGQTPLRLMLSALHQGIPVPLWQWYGIGALTFLAGGLQQLPDAVPEHDPRDAALGGAHRQPGGALRADLCGAADPGLVPLGGGGQPDRHRRLRDRL